MNNQTKHMLLMAAKAGGIAGDFQSRKNADGIELCGIAPSIAYLHWWNPLDDDGDALRLAVTLGMDIITEAQRYDGAHSEVFAVGRSGASVQRTSDIYADIRLAITMAAAKIGESMP